MPATKVSKAVKTTKRSKVSKPKKTKAVKDEVVEVVVDDSVGKKSSSKTTTTNIDLIISLLIEQFSLNDKEVRTTLAEVLPSTSGFKKGKKKKDKDAPKKGLSAYMFFTMARREQVKTDGPELKFTEITQELGRLWRSMNDDDKAPFQTQADADKIRYTTEMKAYRLLKGIPEPSEKKNNGANDPTKILNTSGKYVKRTGKIGRALVEASA
jgi:hypothetical protein